MYVYSSPFYLLAYPGPQLHLDIHLVRIAFLKVMSLPTNFAYNE